VIRLLLPMLMMATSVSLASSQAANPAATAGLEPRQLGDNAMRFVAKDDMKGLFEYMGTIMPLQKSELDKIRDNVIDQRKGVTSKIGAPAGHALISECRKSETLSRLIYAEKRTRSAMRWTFIFYKPRDKWTLVYFFWDDKYTEFFEPCN
jgi:hypothetical protein